jgi:hypothetical protein
MSEKKQIPYETLGAASGKLSFGQQKRIARMNHDYNQRMSHLSKKENLTSWQQASVQQWEADWSKKYAAERETMNNWVNQPEYPR